MTQTAVSDHPGVGKFYTDLNYGQFELGGGIIPPDKNWFAKREHQKDKISIPLEDVTLIRLSDFLKNTVAKRKIPNINKTIFRRITNTPKVCINSFMKSHFDIKVEFIFNLKPFLRH